MAHSITLRILKKTKTQATVKIVGSGNVNISAYDIATPEQTIDAPNLSYPITSVIYNLKGDTSIDRNGNSVIEFNGMTYGTFNLAQDFGISLTDDANANVSVSLATGHNTLILQFSKQAGFIEPEQQLLQPRDR